MNSKIAFFLLCLALMLAPVAFSQSTPPPFFAPPTAYTSGGANSASLAAADLNGDGKTDLAVVNTCGSSPTCSVSVLLGNGDGTFQPAVNYTAGKAPTSVAIADVNGDGNLDLVVANEGSVSILLGNGNGTFQPASSLASIGAGAASIAVGDFNGDGAVDLAISNDCVSALSCTQGGVTIFLGNGNGTFQAPVSYPLGAFVPVFVAVGDFNGDGVPDLVVTSEFASVTDKKNGAVTILVGNGDGTFRTPVSYAPGGYDNFAVAIGDFNGDGRLDLAVVDAGTGSGTYGAVSVFLGNGDGSFQPAQLLALKTHNPESVVVGDFNGDGKLDILVPSECPNQSACDDATLNVLLGNGDGTFQRPASYDAGVTGIPVAVTADFNGDGKPDLALAVICPVLNTCTNGTIAVLLNRPATTTSIESSANPSTFGESVTFTATVSATSEGTPTGTVTFKSGNATLGTGTLSGGVASLSTSALKVGTSSITAAYSGDANYAVSVSSILSQVVNKAAAGDFSIAATPPSEDVFPGQGTSYAATITALNGFAGVVTFTASGLPAGANATFTPPSVTGSGMATMGVTTSPTTPPGTYTVTVTGTSGTLVHSATVTLIVNSGPEPDFSISASPASETVTRGSSTTYTVTVSPLNGFNGIVTISVSGVPSDTSARLSNTTVTGSGSVTLVVAPRTSAPTGTYTLTIDGTAGGGLFHSTTVSLTVN
jgi:hypothetical protein